MSEKISVEDLKQVVELFEANEVPQPKYMVLHETTAEVWYDECRAHYVATAQENKTNPDVYAFCLDQIKDLDDWFREGKARGEYIVQL